MYTNIIFTVLYYFRIMITGFIILIANVPFAEAAKSIYVYNDLGTSSTSLKQTVNMLKDITKGYKILFINAEDIVKKEWIKDAALLVMPGGADIPYTEKLNGEGNKIIKQYVQDGGSYLGICAGAYYGTSFVEFDKNGPLEVIGSRELAFFPNKSIGPILAKYDYKTNSGARAALLTLNLDQKIKSFINSTLMIYSNGGGYFQDAALYKNVDVIAYYQLENNVSLPAILKIKYNKGVVVLSGVHFEYSPKLLNASDQYHAKLLPQLRKSDNDRIKFASFILETLGIETKIKFQKKH